IFLLKIRVEGSIAKAINDPLKNFLHGFRQCSLDVVNNASHNSLHSSGLTGPKLIRISSILLSSLCTLRPIRSTRTNKSRIAAFSHDGCQSFRMSTHRRFLASAARRMLAYTPGRLLRIFAVSDFSGLTSSACALASAEASAATDSLDR